MKKYYKLYILKDSKLSSRFERGKYIELNKTYEAQDSNYKLCFANINHILDYKEEHGLVVCDIEPLGEVSDSLLSSKVESKCECIIARNPRSIYSPEFIRELITYGNGEAWYYVSCESYVLGAIMHSEDGMCYDVDLSYNRSEALQLLLCDEYNNEELNKWFEDRRPTFDYDNIAKMVKNDRESKEIVINAWNKYAPCMKSKVLRLLNYIIN